MVVAKALLFLAFSCLCLLQFVTAEAVSTVETDAESGEEHGAEIWEDQFKHHGESEGEHGEGEHGEAEEGEAGEEEEEEHFARADVEVAWMLLGSVSFVMFLFYLVTWPDDDIRRYTWKVLSSTISIFLAVLLFSGFNEVLEEVIVGFGERIAVLIHFIHCLLYIVLMQLSVGYISGAMFEKGTVDLDVKTWVINDAMREDHLEPVAIEKVRNPNGEKSVFIDMYGMEVNVMKRKLELEMRERRMKCYATLLAHMAGFAAIFAGGTMQQLEVFRTSPLLSLIPVIVTQILVMAVFHIFGALRQMGHQAALQAGGQGRRMRMMMEELEDAENDILSMAMSFLTVQVVRFAIVGSLPNVEGLEEPELPHTHSQMALLFGIGCAFAVAAVVLVLVHAKAKLEAKESACTRITGVVLNGCAMCFAWCTIWGARWIFVKYAWVPVATMFGRVILAFVLSVIACLAVFGLDSVDDMHRGSEDSISGAQAIQVIVNAIAILVGFSWEQCFDHGVVAIASTTEHPDLVKLSFGMGITIVVMPMWRRHILMKSMVLARLKEDREGARRQLGSRVLSTRPAE